MTKWQKHKGHDKGIAAGAERGGGGWSQRAQWGGVIGHSRWGWVEPEEIVGGARGKGLDSGKREAQKE